MSEPTSENGISYSGEIQYLEAALDDQKARLVSLRSAMDSFKPLPMEAFAATRDSELARLKAINKPENWASVEEMNDRNFDFEASEQWQFYRRFEREFPSALVTCTLTAHALCEATINANLAIGLHFSGKAALFNTLENNKLEEKWSSAPLAFCDRYQFPRGGLMYSTLKELVAVRNSLTHQKIHLRDAEGITVTAPRRKIPIAMEANDRLKLQRFLALPHALQAHFLMQICETKYQFSCANILRHDPFDKSSGDDRMKAVK